MPSVSTLSLAIRTRAKKGQAASFDRTSVYLRFSLNGQIQYVPTGEQVDSSIWDQMEGRVKTPPRLSREETDSRNAINARLLAALQRARAAFVEAERNGIAFNAPYLKSALAPKEEKPKDSPDMLGLWQQFIEGAKAGSILTGNGQRIKPATIIAYQQALNSVKEWAKTSRYKCDFETFTRHKCEHFTAWSLAKSLQASTINSRVKNIKVFCKWAEANGHTKHSHYEGMVKPRVGETDFVYLTQDELSRLAQSALPAHLERVRDLFLLQAETGLRYSDMANLKPESRQGGRLVFTTIKTEDKLAVPLSPTAIALFEKYELTGLPRAIESQAYNREIKEACRLSGISDPTPVIKIREGLRVDSTIPKCERVSSHTARRTFIIHALERGIRPEVLMRVTGHKDIKTLMRYVKITQNVVEAEFARAWDKATFK